MLGDLFNMLLPMLSIYQEYVRNYHYSLQTLTECKQRPACKRLFKMYEEKIACTGRTLDFFLTYPMHRIPSYIITLHQLLAHTPHDHVERTALDNARSALEKLSTLMHDEVSETENIRKNLSVERQIAEGCEMLLDVNQIFIRQGDLVQITEKAKMKSFLKSSDSRKEALRHCFLFSGYLLLTTRSSSGRFHLSKNGSGTVPLVEATLVEDYVDEEGEGDSVGLSRGSTQEKDLNELTFRLLVKAKEREGPAISIVLMAPSAQEKAAWTSDIIQCIENLVLAGTEDSSVTKQNRASVRSDQRLFTDDVDIKYCKALNACKLPKIRYASLERLLERLLDLRFLSIDFLNTFLITHRVFTSSETLLDTLRTFVLNSSVRESSAAQYGEVFSPANKKERSVSLPTADLEDTNTAQRKAGSRKKFPSRAPRPSITVSDFKTTEEHESPGVRAEGNADRLCPNVHYSYRRHSSPSALGETAEFEFPSSPDGVTDSQPHQLPSRHNGRRNQSSPFLSRGTVRTRAQSSSSDFGSQNESRSLLETWSCIAASPEEENVTTKKFLLQSPPKRRSRRGNTARDSAEKASDAISGSSSKVQASTSLGQGIPADQDTPVARAKRKMMDVIGLGTTDTTIQGEEVVPKPSRSPQRSRHVSIPSSSASSGMPPLDWLETSNGETSHDGEASTKNKRASSPCRLYKIVKEAEERITNISTTPTAAAAAATTTRRQKSPSTSPISSPRCPRSPVSPSANAGVVVTSSKPSRRRSSISVAAAAFAAATAGASSPSTHSTSSKFRFGHAVQNMLTNQDSHQATMRVLTVLRHWVTKYPEDFAEDSSLKEQLMSFMNELLADEDSTKLEEKFAAAIVRTLNVNNADRLESAKFANEILCTSGPVDPASFDKFATTQLAEQLTFLGQWYFSKIQAREFLNLSWMKEDKCTRAPNILKVTQRFNETSQLVASEILRRPTPSTRAQVIEKWGNVAELCRTLHNFNSVLEITSALMSSSVHRLKKTWEKVSKQTRGQIDRLQKLVTAEGRFKSMRDALRHADGPCIPYLGLYLNDLAFIEDGTPDCNEDGLTNFSKMRMIAQVIQEIRQYQQVTHNFGHEEKVIRYLLSKELLMDEEMLYRTSLLLEPRKRTSSKVKHTPEVEI